jgi:hypothetical protein
MDRAGEPRQRLIISTVTQGLSDMDFNPHEAETIKTIEKRKLQNSA